MKKYITFIVGVLTFHFCFGQEIADFEALLTEEESYLNGSSGENAFQNGGIELEVDYNAEWASWTGWAISNITDNQSPGFNNQYSAIPGKGAESSDNYAVTYCPAGSILKLINPNTIVEGFYVSNSTYAYFSMLNGDSFAKKFGGESGNDPDYLSLTIKAYYQGSITNDSVRIFLADYRFEDNNQDYLLDDWLWVDLKELGVVDSLQFTLHSSDTGSFGINTPTYFCIDQVLTGEFTTGLSELISSKITLLGNPVKTELIIRNTVDESMSISLIDYSGRQIKNLELNTDIMQLDVEHLPAGIYFLRVQHQEAIRFVKL